MPKRGGGPARPPQENRRRGRRPLPNRGRPSEATPGKKEEGTEAMAQPGEGPARPPQEKWRRGPRPWPNRGKAQRGPPRKNGGGDGGQGPTGGGPGEAITGKMEEGAEAKAQRGGWAGRGPQEKWRRGKRPGPRWGCSWRRHQRFNQVEIPKQAAPKTDQEAPRRHKRPLRLAEKSSKITPRVTKTA